MTPSAVLELTGVGFAYDRGGAFLFRDLNAVFREGQVYCVTGENGSGKTTLFNVLCGLLKPSEGRIAYYGREDVSLSPVILSRFAGGLTRTFQTPVLVDTLSVEDNVRLAHRSKDERFRTLFLPRQMSDADQAFETRIEALFRKLRLTSLKRERAERLSYGMRRLIATTVALATNARLVLLDEPFANVDPEHNRLLQEVIVEEAHEGERCILVIEHAYETDELTWADFICPLDEDLVPTPQVEYAYPRLTRGRRRE